ncbi:MAG: hypothetical protein ACOYNY_39930, partial [Caldilineaceae bacterium]
MINEQTLSPHEAAILLAFTGAEEAVALLEVTRRSRLDLAQARSAVERLKLRGAVDQTGEQVDTRIALSDFGEQCRIHQIPELRLVTVLATQGTQPVQALQSRNDLDRAEAGAAFGALRRGGLLVIENNTAYLDPNADLSEVHVRQQLVGRVGTAGEVGLHE